MSWEDTPARVLPALFSPLRRYLHVSPSLCLPFHPRSPSLQPISAAGGGRYVTDTTSSCLGGNTNTWESAHLQVLELNISSGLLYAPKAPEELLGGRLLQRSVCTL